MPSIDQLLSDLDEVTIAKRIGIPHDEARMRYRLDANTVKTFEEFCEKIAHYYNYHFTACVSSGGLSQAETLSRAKGILIRAYSEQKRGKDINAPYQDALDGSNGGIRALLDIMYNHMKNQAIEHYIHHTFDSHVKPVSWEEKVEIIRQFIQKFESVLSSGIEVDMPERYARDYKELIQAFVSITQEALGKYRRV